MGFAGGDGCPLVCLLSVSGHGQSWGGGTIVIVYVLVCVCKTTTGVGTGSLWVFGGTTVAVTDDVYGRTSDCWIVCDRGTTSVPHMWGGVTSTSTMTVYT